MKKFSFLALALFATALVGCKEDNKQTDNPVVVEPKVTLKAGVTTESTIAFEVTSSDAEAVSYLVYEGETAPAAEDIFANGVAVEVNKTVAVTVDELEAETTYRVVAAAKAGDKVTVADAIELTTDEGQDTPPTPPGPEDEIKISRVEGGLSSFKNYRLWVYLTNEAMLYFDVICPDSEHNMIPAHEYPIVFMGDPEAEVETEYEYYIHGDGSSYHLGNNMVNVYDGKVTVSHLDEGYGLDIDIVLYDNERTELKLAFEGIIPPSAIGGDFRNPPYVEPEKNEVTVTITEVGAAFGNDPGDMWYFWIDTADDDAYDAFLELVFPKVTDGVLPAATYTYAKDYASFRDADGAVLPGEYRILCSSAYESHIGDKAADSYIALVEGTTVTIEHGEGTYKITLNLVGDNGTIVKGVYEGNNFRKQWDWAGANEFQYPGAGGNTPAGPKESVMKGACRSDAFELWVYEPEQTSEILYISGSHTGTVLDIIPEGEYPFYTEWKEGINYVRADWSSSYNPDWTNLADGLLTVAHTESGYDITVECTDNNGVTYSYAFNGTMEANNEWSSLGNPPIPYDENTYTLTFDKVDGSANGNYFNLSGYTPEGGKLNLTLETPGKGFDGIIPAGTYAIDNPEYKVSADYAADAEAGNYLKFNTISLVVSHLEQGYNFEFTGTNPLKTTYVVSWSGVVETQEYAQYPFENPGIEIPAYYDLTFTTATYDGLTTDNEGGQTIRQWTLTNEAGDTLQLKLDAVFTENGVVAGTYESCWGFESWYGYEMGQQKFYGNMPLTVAGSGQAYPYYVSSGAIVIEDAGEGNFKLTWAGYLYIDGQKKVKIAYTGPLAIE